MYLVTEEKKRWYIGRFFSHKKVLYIYRIESERETTLFKGGQYCQTVEEVFNIIRKELER